MEWMLCLMLGRVHRYDHHQKGFDEVFGHGFSTKLSSARLVHKHFGKEIIAKELQVNEGHPDVHRLFSAVYKNFVEMLKSVCFWQLMLSITESISMIQTSIQDMLIIHICLQGLES